MPFERVRTMKRDTAGRDSLTQRSGLGLKSPAKSPGYLGGEAEGGAGQGQRGQVPTGCCDGFTGGRGPTVLPAVAANGQ